MKIVFHILFLLSDLPEELWVECAHNTLHLKEVIQCYKNRMGDKLITATAPNIYIAAPRRQEISLNHKE